MKIVGRFETIKRELIACPQDGVHQASDKTGMMKGTHSVWLTTEGGRRILCPKGQTAFYYNYKPGLGVKVFFRVDDQEKLHAFRKGAMLQEYHNRTRLYKAGVAPKPYGIKWVKLNVRLGKDHFVGGAWAIKTQHIQAPQQAWEDYARGIPYDFKSFDHPLHSPEGYKAFCKEVLHALKKTGTVICKGKPSLKLGDVMFDTLTKRWYLVDAG